MFVDENPDASLDDVLAHYGVLGMKWGQRKKATTADIHAARRKVGQAQRQYGQLEDKMTYGKNENKAKNAALEKQMKALDEHFHADPARAIASRTTRGEKAALLMLAGPIGAAIIVGQSAVSRHIEYTTDKANGRKP
jgi:superfamily II DNA or RNA helicase